MRNKNRWIIAGLAAANAILGVAAWQALTPASAAFAQGRRGSDYMVLSRRTQNYLMVYALDTNTGNLAALRQDTQQKQIQVVARRDIQADFGRSTR
jgi:predicted secreted hydrolase